MVDTKPGDELVAHMKNELVRNGVRDSLGAAYRQRAPRFTAAAEHLAIRKNPQRVGMTAADVQKDPVEALARAAGDELFYAGATVYNQHLNANAKPEDALRTAKEFITGEAKRLGSFGRDEGEFWGAMQRVSWTDDEGRGGYRFDPQDFQKYGLSGPQSLLTAMDRKVDLGSKPGAFARRFLGWTLISNLVRSFNKDAALVHRAIEENASQGDDRMLSGAWDAVATYGAVLPFLAESALFGAITGGAQTAAAARAGEALKTAGAAQKTVAGMKAARAFATRRNMIYLMGQNAASDYSGDVGMGQHFRENAFKDRATANFMLSRVFDWATITTSMGLSDAASGRWAARLLTMSKGGFLAGTAPLQAAALNVGVDVATDYLFFNAMESAFKPSGLGLTADYVRRFGPDGMGIGRDVVFRLGMRGVNSILRPGALSSGEDARNISSSAWWKENDLASGWTAGLYAGIWRTFDPHMKTVVEQVNADAMRAGSPATAPFGQMLREGTLDRKYMVSLILLKERAQNKMLDDVFSDGIGLSVPALLGKIPGMRQLIGGPTAGAPDAYHPPRSSLNLIGLETGARYLEYATLDSVDKARDYFQAEASRVRANTAGRTADETARYIAALRMHIREDLPKELAPEIRNAERLAYHQAYAGDADPQSGTKAIDLFLRRDNISEGQRTEHGPEHETAFSEIMRAAGMRSDTYILNSRGQLKPFTPEDIGERAREGAADAEAGRQAAVIAADNQMLDRFSSLVAAYLDPNLQAGSISEIRQEAVRGIEQVIRQDMAATVRMLGSKEDHATKLRHVNATVSAIRWATDAIGRFYGGDFRREVDAFLQKQPVKDAVAELWSTNRGIAEATIFGDVDRKALAWAGVDLEKEGMAEGLRNYIARSPFRRMEQVAKFGRVLAMSEHFTAPPTGAIAPYGLTVEIVTREWARNTGNYADLTGDEADVRFYITDGPPDPNDPQYGPARVTTAARLASGKLAADTNMVAFSDNAASAYGVETIEEIAHGGVKKIHAQETLRVAQDGGTLTVDDRVRQRIADAGLDNVILYHGQSPDGGLVLSVRNPEANARDIAIFALDAIHRPIGIDYGVQPTIHGSLATRRYAQLNADDTEGSNKMTFAEMEETIEKKSSSRGWSIRGAMEAIVRTSGGTREAIRNVSLFLRTQVPEVRMSGQNRVWFATTFVNREFVKAGVERSMNLEMLGNARKQGIQSSRVPVVRVDNIMLTNSGTVVSVEVDDLSMADMIIDTAAKANLIPIMPTGAAGSPTFYQVPVLAGVAGKTAADEARAAARIFEGYIRQFAPDERVTNGTPFADAEVAAYTLLAGEIDAINAGNPGGFARFIADQGTLGKAYQAMLTGALDRASGQRFSGILPALRRTYSGVLKADLDPDGRIDPDGYLLDLNNEIRRSATAFGDYLGKMDPVLQKLQQAATAGDMKKAVDEFNAFVAQGPVLSQTGMFADAGRALSQMAQTKFAADDALEIVRGVMADYEIAKRQAAEAAGSTGISDVIAERLNDYLYFFTPEQWGEFNRQRGIKNPGIGILSAFAKQSAALDGAIGKLNDITDEFDLRSNFYETLVMKGRWITGDPQKRASSSRVYSAYGRSRAMREAIDRYFGSIKQDTLDLVIVPERTVNFLGKNVEGDGAAFTIAPDALFNYLFGSAEGGMKLLYSTMHGDLWKTMFIRGRDANLLAGTQIAAHDVRGDYLTSVRPGNNTIIADMSMIKMLTPAFFERLGVSKAQIARIFNPAGYIGNALRIRLNLADGEVHSFFSGFGFQAERTVSAKDVIATPNQSWLSTPEYMGLMNAVARDNAAKYKNIAAKAYRGRTGEELVNNLAASMRRRLELPGLYVSAVPEIAPLHEQFDVSLAHNRADEMYAIADLGQLVHLARREANAMNASTDEARAKRRDLLARAERLESWRTNARAQAGEVIARDDVTGLLDLIAENGRGSIQKRDGIYYISMVRMPNQYYGQFLLAQLKGVRGLDIHAGIEVSAGVQRLQNMDFDGDTIIGVPVKADVWQSLLDRKYTGAGSFADKLRRLHAEATRMQHYINPAVMFSYPADLVSTNVKDQFRESLNTGRMVAAASRAIETVESQIALYDDFGRMVADRAITELGDVNVKISEPRREEAVMYLTKPFSVYDPDGRLARLRRPAPEMTVLFTVDSNNYKVDGHGAYAGVARSAKPVKIGDRSLFMVAANADRHGVLLLVEDDGITYGERVVAQRAVEHRFADPAAALVGATRELELIAGRKRTETDVVKILDGLKAGWVHGSETLRMATSSTIFSQANTSGTDNPRYRGNTRVTTFSPELSDKVAKTVRIGSYFLIDELRDGAYVHFRDITRLAAVPDGAKADVRYAPVLDDQGQPVLDTQGRPVVAVEGEIIPPGESRTARIIQQQSGSVVSKTIRAVIETLDQSTLISPADYALLLDIDRPGVKPGDFYRAMRKAKSLSDRGVIANFDGRANPDRVVSPRLLENIRKLTAAYDDLTTRAASQPDSPDRFISALPDGARSRIPYEPLAKIELDEKATEADKAYAADVDRLLAASHGRPVIIEDVARNIRTAQRALHHVYGEGNPVLFQLYRDDLHNEPLVLADATVRAADGEEPLVRQVIDVSRAYGMNLSHAFVTQFLNRLGVTVKDAVGVPLDRMAARERLANRAYTLMPGGERASLSMLRELELAGETFTTKPALGRAGKDGRVSLMSANDLVEAYQRVLSEMEEPKFEADRQRMADAFAALIQALEPDAGDIVHLRGTLGITDAIARDLSTVQYDGQRLPWGTFVSLGEGLLKSGGRKLLDREHLPVNLDQVVSRPFFDATCIY